MALSIEFFNTAKTVCSIWKNMNFILKSNNNNRKIDITRSSSAVPTVPTGSCRTNLFTGTSLEISSYI